MRIIEVIPNPYIALDKDGIPQGVVAFPGNPRSSIGAEIDLVASHKTGKTRWVFPLGKNNGRVKVQLDHDISCSVQAGELLLVNREDAACCGLTDKEFLAPEEALKAEMKKALAYYQSIRGKDAKLGEIPRQAMELKEGESLADAAKPKVVSDHITVTMSPSGDHTQES